MRTSLVSALLLSLLLVQKSQAIIIDDFKSGELNSATLDPRGGSITFQDSSSSEFILGGNRITQLMTDSAANTNLTLDTELGVLSYNSSDNSTGMGLAYGLVTPNDRVNTPYHFDLTSDTSNSFFITLSNVSPNAYSADFYFNIKAEGQFFTYDFSQDLENLDSSGHLAIPYANFNNMDMSDIQAIIIYIGNVPNDSTFSISAITTGTIPEPAAYVSFLGVASLLGAFAARRRR